MTSDRPKKIPWVSLGFIALCILIYMWESRALSLGLGDIVISDYGFDWNAFRRDPVQQAPTLFSCVFIHVGAEHLIGNLIFFALFAPLTELALGHLYFLAAFVIWAASAALLQGFFRPFAGPMVGASGAISGTAGAFLVLYPLRSPFWASLKRADLPPPSARFNTVQQIFQSGLYLSKVFLFIASRIPAVVLIGLWFYFNFKAGLGSLRPDLHVLTPVAHWAHIGGFFCGALTTAPIIFEKNPRS